ncbi:MAG: Fic family protein [Victivallales bacterium]|nr:Fic family protein [Victivallales bacterium]
MHIFNYDFLQDTFLPVQIVNLASNINVLRLVANERQKVHKEIFQSLETIAKVESVKASNAIEGIVTTDKRIHEIVQYGSTPLNHTEAEIAGYRDVLNEVHSNWRQHDFSEKDIQLFHAQMMRLLDPASTGAYKQDDNVIAERMADGRNVVRFIPVSAADTPKAMEQLTLAYQIARDNASINKLLLIPCVILDFLCVHPFADGNGRISRLLSLLLLYRNGFDAGKYISFENQICNHKVEYYQALKDSSENWHTNLCRYFPFMMNFIMTLYACYTELDKRFAVVNSSRITKKGRIEATILNALTPLSKADICRILPDVSPTTVEVVLGRLHRAGQIITIGKGRSTKYLRK